MCAPCVGRKPVDLIQDHKIGCRRMIND